jgi:hypothetical protein
MPPEKMMSWLRARDGSGVARWFIFKPELMLFVLFTFQTRENFNSSREDIQALMRKMLEVRQAVSRSGFTSFDPRIYLFSNPAQTYYRGDQISL